MTTLIRDRGKSFEDGLVEYQADRILASFPQYMLDPAISFDDKLDIWESFVFENCEQLDCPLDHTFPDGLYVRKITMPSGAVITSRIHKFDNPFFILSGKVIVLSENEGQVIYSAGDSGITKPGTRRLLLILQETVWSTVHPNPGNSQDIPTLEDHMTHVPTRRRLEAGV